VKPINSGLGCPSCRQPLKPKVLACDSCGIRVEGPFELNEFAGLSGDDLHLLRIFVLSEGRVRDMEAPLGLSYPTIRARLRDLRERIAGGVPAAAPPLERPASPQHSAEILDRLGRGELTFEEAMNLMRKQSESKETP
jgi:hypothetical protein